MTVEPMLRPEVFQIGDRVRVKSWDELAAVCRVEGRNSCIYPQTKDGVEVGSLVYVRGMEKNCGKELTISGISEGTFPHYDFAEGPTIGVVQGYMLEKVVSEEADLQPPTDSELSEFLFGE